MGLFFSATLNVVLTQLEKAITQRFVVLLHYLSFAGL